MRRLIACAAITIAVLITPVPAAKSFERGHPEDVGFSSEQLGRLTEMLRSDANRSAIPGATLLIVRHGKLVWFESVGLVDPVSKVPLSGDAIFRIYSMSKPIT